MMLSLGLGVVSATRIACERENTWFSRFQYAGSSWADQVASIPPTVRIDLIARRVGSL